MKTPASLSPRLIITLRLTGLVLVICLGWLWLVRPEGSEPKLVMTPRLKLFYQKTTQIHPGMTEAQVRKVLGPPDSAAIYPLFNSGHSYQVWQWNAPDDPHGGYRVEADETGLTMPSGMYPD